jgi:hypothetical protein
MRYLLIAMVVATVGGCAPIMWEKPGLTQGQFAQDDARCKLVAKGMNSGGFYAEGKPAFVAGAALGNAIGTAVATRVDYKNCMIASGYTEQAPQMLAPAQSPSAEAPSCGPICHAHLDAAKAAAPPAMSPSIEPSER